MKKTKYLVVCLLVVAVITAVVLSGCNLDRKLQGVEIKFQQKVSKESKYSFDVHLNIQSGDT